MEGKRKQPETGFLPVKYLPTSHLEVDQFRVTGFVQNKPGNLLCTDEAIIPKHVFATTPPGMDPYSDLDQRAHLKRMEYLLGVYAKRPDYFEYQVMSKRGRLMWIVGATEKLQ